MPGTLSNAKENNETFYGANRDMTTHTVEMIADGAGEFLDYDINIQGGGLIVQVEVDLSSSPTPDRVDLTITSASKADILRGHGYNITTTKSLDIQNPLMVYDSATLKPSGNTVANAALKMVVYVLS